MGAFVRGVEKGSPADKAGMEDLDVIVELGGDTIAGQGHLKDILSYTPPGEILSLKVWRKGKTIPFEVTLGNRAEFYSKEYMLENEKKLQALMKAKERELEDNAYQKIMVLSGDPRSWLGVRTQDLSDQLAEFFGVSEGVLITEVIEDGPAALSGISAGDVLVTVEDQEIQDPIGLTNIIDEIDPDTEIKIEIVRDGKRMEKKVLVVETPVKFRSNIPQIFSFSSDDEDYIIDLRDAYGTVLGLPKVPIVTSPPNSPVMPDVEIDELKDQLRSLTIEMKELQKEITKLRAESDD
jgi:C-terminal processing protease CtpA/Prc